MCKIKNTLCTIFRVYFSVHNSYVHKPECVHHGILHNYNKYFFHHSIYTKVLSHDTFLYHSHFLTLFYANRAY